jgi:hypothetical protein
MFQKILKGAPYGNKNAAGPHGKAKAPAYRHHAGASIVDGLDAVIPGKLKMGRNMIDGHPVDALGGDGAEGVDFRAVDGDAATGAIKYLRKLGFPVTRIGTAQFTVGGKVSKKSEDDDTDDDKKKKKKPASSCKDEIQEGFFQILKANPLGINQYTKGGKAGSARKALNEMPGMTSPTVVDGNLTSYSHQRMSGSALDDATAAVEKHLSDSGFTKANGAYKHSDGTTAHVTQTTGGIAGAGKWVAVTASTTAKERAVAEADLKRKPPKRTGYLG